MTTLASTIIDKAKILALDKAGIRTGNTEWLGWLNDAQRDVVVMRPSAWTKSVSCLMVEGTQQTLPLDAIRFERYVRYMGDDGNTPGPAARRSKIDLLDARTPTWHAAPAGVPQHFFFDPELPLQFQVSPPSLGGVFAQIVYAACPPVIAAVNDPIHLPDVYANVLLDGLLFRGYGKDSESIVNAERSAYHRKLMESALGFKARADSAT